MNYKDNGWQEVDISYLKTFSQDVLVVLDIRADSFTFGKWESYIISEKTRDQVLIPPGFANGHYALTDCIFHYNLFYEGEYVDENNQGVIKWNDSSFKIEWPTIYPILQRRDG